MPVTRSHLSLVTDGDVVDAPEPRLTPIDPLRPADPNAHAGLPVPCPLHVWCMGHEAGESITAAAQHSGEVHNIPAATLNLDLTDGVASVAFTPDFGQTVFLAPHEAIERAAALLAYALAAKAVAA